MDNNIKLLQGHKTGFPDIIWIVHNAVGSGLFPIRLKEPPKPSQFQWAEYEWPATYVTKADIIQQLPRRAPMVQVALRTGFSVFRNGCDCMTLTAVELETASTLDCICPQLDRSLDNNICEIHKAVKPCDGCAMSFNPYHSGDYNYIKPILMPIKWVEEIFDAATGEKIQRTSYVKKPIVPLTTQQDQE